MKICAFSDIHGNIEAFQKMYVSEAEHVDLFIFLGDIFGYFYYQDEILEKIMSMKNLYAIAGNHEKNYISCMDNNNNKKIFIDKYGSSYNIHLSPQKMNYIMHLPDHQNIFAEEKKIGLFHSGELIFGEKRIYPDTFLKHEKQIDQYNYIFLGHTHYRLQKRLGNTQIINPGSLGQPRDGMGFSYAILDTQTDAVIFKSVELDIYHMLQAVKEKDENRTVYSYLKRKYG